MRKPKTMAVVYEDGTQVYAVVYRKLSAAPAYPQNLPCGHCPTGNTTPSMDIVQFGFFDDTHQLVCHCPDCLQLTVYEYRIGDENASEKHT